MAIDAPTPDIDRAVPTANLPVTDNRMLADLGGPGDINIAKVEQLLGVVILRRNSGLVIHGEEHDAVDRARDVLAALCDRLEQGKAVEPGDVDAALRMRRPDPQPAEATERADQMEMFAGAPMEFRTRKRTVEPRSNTQKSYVHQLYANELVFGIGPAGTGKTYLAVAAGDQHVPRRCRRPHHPVAPGRRGRRAAGLPARRHEGEGRSLHAAALRRAQRFPARASGAKAHRGQEDRDRTAGLHARAHAVELPSSSSTRRRTRRRCR